MRFSHVENMIYIYIHVHIHIGRFQDIRISVRDKFDVIELFFHLLTFLS